MAMAFVMGSAARNGTLPEAAVGSILLAQIPVVVACLVTRDPFYAWFAMFVVLFTVAAGSVAKHVYLQTVGLLVAGEETAALVGEVGRSNRELGFANERFERANLQLAATNAAFAAANTQLELANAQLAALARTDALTGLPNRRAFDEYVEKETRAALREGACLSLLILDIDFFKNFNDHYGHQRGDECLQLIARTLASCARRPRELVARYGGEEFVAILPQTDSAGAAALAETMRVAVAGLKLEQAPSVGGIVTVSIGVTTWRPGTFEDAAAMLRRVDRALYDAKDSGRNCICVAAEAPMSTDGSETAE